MSRGTIPTASTSIDGPEPQSHVFPTITTMEELGLRSTLFLAALLRAQAYRVPVAPTLSSALHVLDSLQSLSLIQVPWPADRWQIRPDAEVTPLEDLQWVFSWPTHERERLLPALEDQLGELALNEALVEQRVALWNELAMWEAEHFLEQQLRLHRFDTNWARDLKFASRTAPPGLPIAQWRYCCWAAVRQGASVALRQSLRDEAGIREAIFLEMKKRLRYLTNGPTQLGMFVPFHMSPASAVAKLFVELVVPLGWAYWTSKRTDTETQVHLLPVSK